MFSPSILKFKGRFVISILSRLFQKILFNFVTSAHKLLLRTEKRLTEMAADKDSENTNANNAQWIDEMKRAHKILADKINPYLDGY